MIQYEYKIVSINNLVWKNKIDCRYKTSEELTEEINKLGWDGWRIISVTLDYSEYTLFLERETSGERNA